MKPRSKRGRQKYQVRTHYSHAFAFCLALSSKVNADDFKQRGELHRQLTMISTGTSLEPAGSHGPAGFSLGAGAVSVDAAVKAAALDGDSRWSRTLPSDESITIPSVWLTKGLFWPVDVSVDYGTSETADLKRLNGCLQWTLYQDFAQPAVAVRLNHTRLDAPEQFSAEVTAVHLAASWGYGPISLMGSVGTQKSTSFVYGSPTTDFGVYERIGENPDRFDEYGLVQTSYGAALQIPGTLFSLTAEAVQLDRRFTSIAAKLALGM